MSPRAELGGVSPFFIVKNVTRSVAYYVDVLGFERRYAEPDDHPFFAIVGRDGAQIFLKHFGGDIAAQPNPTRHPGAPWDAFVYVDDPDKLHGELSERDVRFRRNITNRTDGLRGFEVKDADGYVLFFGRPQS